MVILPTFLTLTNSNKLPTNLITLYIVKSRKHTMMYRNNVEDKLILHQLLALYRHSESQNSYNLY